MASTGGTWKGSRFFNKDTKTAQKARAKTPTRKRMTRVDKTFGAELPIGRLGSGKKATAPVSANNPQRQYGASVYNAVKKIENNNDYTEKVKGGYTLSYGPIVDTSRGGTKFAAYGWKVQVEGQDGYTYFSGDRKKTEKEARDFISSGRKW